jgi:glycosyltransferase involved in cell wall biosynthesis
MRVLYFLDTVGRGGAEMQALDVCRNASRFGIDLTFVTARGGSLEADFRSSGADFVWFERRFPLDVYLVSQLRRIIKERRIQIVHGYQAVDGVHLHFATRGLRGVKKVLSFQGFVYDRKNRLTLKYLIPRFDRNLAVSRSLREWLAEIDRLDTGSFRVLYNGADPQRLSPTGNSIRAELGIASDAIVFGMVANFYRDPRKDQITVCRALPNAMEVVPNLQFIFAGGIENGAEDKMAECLQICIDSGIADRVHFIGARSDVPDVLSSLDGFVFSSLHEGLPVALTEAMLAGVPVIHSDIGPLLEATAHGEYARVFPVGDAEQLAESMIEFATDASLRLKLAANARSYAAEKFSIEAHMRSLVEIYRELI